ncbi:MAG TPA: hypothetical protein VN641_07020 [Urbifossiella sp.]|nr:hypothetical protein [Urbifossiella sp.]
MFEIVAEIEGGFDDPDVLCAFDPNKVVFRLRQLFPGLEVDPQDYAWRDFDLFTRHGLVDEAGALGVAARDARRRGPVWLFRLPTEDGAICGKAERHFVSFTSKSPFPEPLRSRLIAFVEGLRFAPCVTVKCVRIEGNDQHPA